MVAHCVGILVPTRATMPSQVPQIFSVFLSCLSFPGGLQKLPEQQIKLSWALQSASE